MLDFWRACAKDTEPAASVPRAGLGRAVGVGSGAAGERYAAKERHRPAAAQRRPVPQEGARLQRP